MGRQRVDLERLPVLSLQERTQAQVGLTGARTPKRSCIRNSTARQDGRSKEKNVPSVSKIFLVSRAQVQAHFGLKVRLMY